VRFARRGSSGFTLIELVVVMLIVGLIFGLAITRLDFMVPKYRIRGAARDVAAVLKQGKARAAASGKDVFFECDLSAGRYWLLAAFPRNAETADLKTADPKDVEYQPVFLRLLPDGVQFTDIILGDKEKIASGRMRLRLSPFGVSNHAIVNLKNTDGQELALKMNGFTGLIFFADHHLDADELLEDRGP
jgi:prepilin-type N-terminal cleavage/methylation domain-containing protein